MAVNVEGIALRLKPALEEVTFPFDATERAQMTVYDVVYDTVYYNTVYYNIAYDIVYDTALYDMRLWSRVWWFLRPERIACSTGYRMQTSQGIESFLSSQSSALLFGSSSMPSSPARSACNFCRCPSRT